MKISELRYQSYLICCSKLYDQITEVHNLLNEISIGYRSIDKILQRMHRPLQPSYNDGLLASISYLLPLLEIRQSRLKREINRAHRTGRGHIAEGAIHSLETISEADFDEHIIKTRRVPYTLNKKQQSGKKR